LCSSAIFLKIYIFSYFLVFFEAPHIRVPYTGTWIFTALTGLIYPLGSPPEKWTEIHDRQAVIRRINIFSGGIYE
jgi:hypothetical protein